MNEQPASVSWMTTDYTPSQPATYTMEVNGTTYGPLVDLDLYARMREERDALKARVQALLEDQDELHDFLRAADDRLHEETQDLFTTHEERDRAIRQRDHARDIATRYAAIWGTTDMYEPVECVPADDGWVPGSRGI